MSEQPKDGGPAFPTTWESGTGAPSGKITLQGMSLRDWFAGQVAGHYAKCVDLPGDIHRPTQLWSAQQVALRAYKVADAMLAARERPTP